MPSIHEILTQQFRRWEIRGRGWRVYDEPVSPEPAFEPFQRYTPPETPALDDGRRPTALSSFVQKLSRQLSTQPPAPPPILETVEEPEPHWLIRDALVEFRATLPAKLDISKDAFEHFLLNLSLCREPIAFELLGVENRVTAQFAAHPDDAPLIRRQLQAHFPDAVFQAHENTLESAWDTCSGEDDLVVEFGLAREFMLPLASGKLDPFIGIIGSLSELQWGELALFQVLFHPVREPWADSILQSVTHADGKPFFVNAPELAKAAENKTSKPLYGAVVRIAIRTESEDRTLQLARDLAASLRVFAHPSGNELIPLSNADYPFEEHLDDVLRRQSRRSGMLLNSDELIGFVHLPGSAVRSRALEREAGRSKAAPAIVRQANGVLVGNNSHAGASIQVRLTAEQRVRHCHIIGASGTGKSTLLLNLIRQDIENGEGVAVLDPHGDLIDRILGVVPEERFSDVILVDPSDEAYSIGFNVLSAHSDLEKTLLSSDLVSVFRRLSTSWGDQMGSVLQNAILAFLESSRGGTLADLRRFLIEPAFRVKCLQSVHDPEVVYYWQHAFPQLSGNKSIGPVLTRLETFLAPKPIRYMVSQPVNRLDFAEIMDSGKILLAKLPQGLLGKENSYLLGTLLVSKLQQTAMSRQAQEITRRRNYWIYVDEFHQFMTPSMAEIVGGARKYRIGLTLAHQELRQLQQDSEVASAVLSNSYTRVVFRVGDDDARKLADGFAFFEARDLQNLPIGEAVCRVERSDFDFNLAVPLPQEPDEAEAAERRRRIITVSREKYGTARAQVEAMLATRLEQSPVPSTARTSASVETPPVTKEKIKATAPPQAKPVSPATPPVTVASNPPAVRQLSGAPQPLEVPKPTDSGKEKVAVPAKPEAPRDLGRGGAQHKAIQERIQAQAHALGFLANVEGQLADKSNEAADLVLRKSDEIIAVEISVTTTIDHEFGNVKKCLSAGFNRIAVVSPRPEHLKAIADAVKAGLGSPQAANVSYHSPDEFIAELSKLAQEAAKSVKPSVPQESTTRGYKVRGHSPLLTVAERKAKEDMAIKLMAETMKRR